MTWMHFGIVFFQCVNIIALGTLLLYVNAHRRRSLSGFFEFLGMTFFLLLSSALFSLSLIDRFGGMASRLFSAGIAVYFLAFGYYARCALCFFGFTEPRQRKPARFFLLVPLMLLTVVCVHPALFLTTSPGLPFRFRADRSAQPVFYAALAYLFVVYGVVLVYARNSRREYLAQNKKQLALSVLIPVWLPSLAMAAEVLFPRQVWGIAGCTAFFLPLIMAYSYWGYFSPSRRIMAEDADAVCVVFDAFGACADLNSPGRRFFRNFNYSKNTLTIRALEDITGLTVTGLLSAGSSVFQPNKGTPQRYYRIDCFAVPLPYLNRLNGTGFLIRDITVHRRVSGIPCPL
ncbi:MAG: hypothetical protein LBS64_05735 [Spirochaetaceae bacterium]|jgi:hypothetical protein|nr:hypothetical protein [Spirochaetaceae bacterium]